MTTKYNKIAAFRFVSESELAVAIDNFSKDLEELEPDKFYKILYDLGVDISRPVERQDGLYHRNMFNKVVLCSRYVGYERLDSEWINSGYASQEAKDKVNGSKLLEDLYRAKGLTEDAQDQLEKKHRYTVIDESVQV